ncbi:MAG: aminoacyl-tRNA hydrolase [Patescibacteria group bacterium]|nr:aminoacyl-tRNA hydrolase [Patescibacteria group bacterium]
MKLIVGLGNPGDKYLGTRHNLGFEIVEKLADSLKSEGFDWKYEKKFQAEILKIDQSLILAKPQTFMNNSGMAVKPLADYYRIPVEDIIIIQDELDLPLGKIKVRKGGAAGGHHGVESVIKSLNDDKFIRVRLGIGPSSNLAERFVLEPFLPSERPKVKHMVKQALEAVDIILEEGLETAQNQFN